MTPQEEKEFIIEDIVRKASRSLILEKIIKEEMTISRKVMNDANIVYQKMMEIIEPFMVRCYEKRLIRNVLKGSFETNLSDNDNIHIEYFIYYFGEDSYYETASKGGMANIGSEYVFNDNSLRISALVIGEKIYSFGLRDSIAHELNHRYEVGQIKQNGGGTSITDLYRKCLDVIDDLSGRTNNQRTVAFALYLSNSKEINANTHGLYASLQPYGYIRNGSQLFHDDSLRITRILDKLDDGISILEKTSANEKREYADIFCGITVTHLLNILQKAKHKYLVKVGKECAMHNMDYLKNNPVLPPIEWVPKQGFRI